MFAGLFAGFSIAFDFESGFARRLMLAAESRRGIALGYALVCVDVDRPAPRRELTPRQRRRRLGRRRASRLQAC